MGTQGTKRARTSSEDSSDAPSAESGPREKCRAASPPPAGDEHGASAETLRRRESADARATRRLHKKAVAEAEPATETPACAKSDAAFQRSSTLTPVEGRAAWLQLLPEMVAVCNEAARRAALRRDPDCKTFDEPLSADYCYDRVSRAPGRVAGYVVREKGGAKRLQGFLLLHEFAALAKSLVFDSKDPASLFGSYGSHESVQRVFHSEQPPSTAAEIVKATDAVARASAADAETRKVDSDAALAAQLQKSPREVRGDRDAKFGGEDALVVWPRLLEISLLGALGCGARLCKRALADRGGAFDALVLQATRSAVGFYEKLGLRRVGCVARFRDRADAPRLAYRHWCTRTVDEPSYVMARRLRGAPRRAPPAPKPAPLDKEVCRARALELAHVAFLSNGAAPGANAAFRECVLLAVGYAGAAGARDRPLALALAECLRVFRSGETREARKMLREAFLARVADDGGGARRSPRGLGGEALDCAGALDGHAVATVDGSEVRVHLRADTLVSATRCTEANGLFKVKVAFGKLVNGKYYKVQHRRVLAKIADPAARRRLLRGEGTG